jgi:hypothetical protein
MNARKESRDSSGKLLGVVEFDRLAEAQVKKAIEDDRASGVVRCLDVLPDEFPLLGTHPHPDYEKHKPTRMFFPVGPKGEWKLELQTQRMNCRMWDGYLRMSVPVESFPALGGNGVTHVTAQYSSSISGALSQRRAIEAVVLAAKHAGWIKE